MERDRELPEEGVAGVTGLPECSERREVRSEMTVGAGPPGRSSPAPVGSPTTSILASEAASGRPGLLPLPRSSPCMDSAICPVSLGSSPAVIPFQQSNLQPSFGCSDASVETCNRFASLLVDTCSDAVHLVNPPSGTVPLSSLDGVSCLPPSLDLQPLSLMSTAPPPSCASPGCALSLGVGSALVAEQSPLIQVVEPVGGTHGQPLHRSLAPKSSLRVAVPAVLDGDASPSVAVLPPCDLAGRLESNYMETCHVALSSFRKGDDLTIDPPSLSASSPLPYSPLYVNLDSATVEVREGSEEGENPCLDKNYLEISGWLENDQPCEAETPHQSVVTPPSGSNRSKGRKKYPKTPGRGRGSKGRPRN